MRISSKTWTNRRLDMNPDHMMKLTVGRKSRAVLISHQQDKMAGLRKDISNQMTSHHPQKRQRNSENMKAKSENMNAENSEEKN